MGNYRQWRGIGEVFCFAKVGGRVFPLGKNYSIQWYTNRVEGRGGRECEGWGGVASLLINELSITICNTFISTHVFYCDMTPPLLVLQSVKSHRQLLNEQIPH